MKIDLDQSLDKITIKGILENGKSSRFIFTDKFNFNNFLYYIEPSFITDIERIFYFNVFVKPILEKYLPIEYINDKFNMVCIESINLILLQLSQLVINSNNAISSKLNCIVDGINQFNNDNCYKTYNGNAYNGYIVSNINLNHYNDDYHPIANSITFPNTIDTALYNIFFSKEYNMCIFKNYDLLRKIIFKESIMKILNDNFKIFFGKDINQKDTNLKISLYVFDYYVDILKDIFSSFIDHKKYLINERINQDNYDITLPNLIGMLYPDDFIYHLFSKTTLLEVVNNDKKYRMIIDDNIKRKLEDVEDFNLYNVIRTRDSFISIVDDRKKDIDKVVEEVTSINSEYKLVKVLDIDHERMEIMNI